jgi:hypothetical protein
MVVTGDMIISDVLNMDRGTIPIFFRNGLHCLAVRWRLVRQSKRPVPCTGWIWICCSTN